MKSFRERLTLRVLLVMTMAIAGLFFLAWSLFQDEHVDVVAILRIDHPQYIVQPSFPEQSDLDESVENVRQSLRLHGVLSSALEHSMREYHALYKDEAYPVSFLAKQIETSMISPNLMEVRVTGNEWTLWERVAILHAVIEAYLTHHKNYEESQRNDLVSRLRDERSLLEESLRQKRRVLEKLEAEKSIDCELRRRELQIAMEVYEKLVRRIEELQVNAGAMSSVTVIDHTSIRKP